MLPKNYRLKLRFEKSNLDQHGSIINHSLFTLVHLKNNLPHPRIGFIVTKKIFSKAVDRNHLRRQLSNLLKEEVTKLPPIDLLLIPKKTIIETNFKTLENEILTTLKEHHLLSN